MRHERVFGFVGLGLFCLFPLVGALQLRDPDAVWREVARRAGPSVLPVHEVASGAGTPGAGPVRGCGVVLDGDPLRIVVVCPVEEGALESPTASGWIVWRLVHADPAGAFTVLEATEGGATRAAASVASPAAAADAVALPRALPGSNPTRVDAALVPPTTLASQPVWIGTLRPARDAAPPDYLATELRRLGATSSAAAPELDPVLFGAPFVSREGALVAILASRRGVNPVALPIERVTSALAAVDGHAER